MPAFIYEKKGRIAYLTINRPETRNAMNREVWDGLVKAWKDVGDNPDIWAAIVTATGDKAFSSGQDLKEMAEWMAIPEDKRPPMPLPEVNPMRGMQVWKPFIAAINGLCIGGGLELAMACDLRVASETARIGDWHIRIGVIGGAGATTRLPRIVGVAKAKELIFTGEALDGKEACRIGLVNQVFPVEKYLDGAMELAKKIAAFKPVTLRKAKESINMGLSMDVHQSLHFSDRCAAEVRAALGADAGRKAFAERKQT